MNTKHYIAPLFACLVSACAATGLQTMNVNQIQLPKSSAGSSRTALANDMVSSVDQFIYKKYDCSDWLLQAVSDSQIASQLVFTTDGQIYHGNFSERWRVQQCESALTLDLEVSPGAQGGSRIRIRTL